MWAASITTYIVSVLNGNIAELCYMREKESEEENEAPHAKDQTMNSLS